MAYVWLRECSIMNGSKTFSKIDIGETIVLRGSKFPFNFEYWKYVKDVLRIQF